MPGPIASAFVDIIARLQLDTDNDLERGLRQSVRRIERDLDRLEGAARQAGRAVARQLSDVRVDLNVREALSDLARVDNAAEAVTAELHNLRGLDVGLDSARATRSINALEDRVSKLARAVQLIDDEEVDLDVATARRQLEALDQAAERLVQEVARLSGRRVDVDFGDAASELQRLQEAVGEALRDLARLDQTRVRVNIEDLEVDQLQRKIERLDAEAVDIRVDTSGLQAAGRQIDRVQNQAGDFSRAFRRILAFGAIRSVASAVSNLFQAGVRAAGAIQLVEVSLNRFFAQSRDLGQTAGEFFGNLRKLALETPFEFKGLAETSRRILAMGVDADDAVSIMTELSDAVAAVGGGQAEIDGVVRALSQLSSKGKVDLQDFRQISENLPSLSRQMQIQGVIDELNDLRPGLDATVADFEDLRKSGLITGKVLRDGIVRAIGEIPGVAGAARAASRTLQGALSNLADFATQEFSRAFQGLGGIIADELNAAFGSVTEGDALTPLAEAMRDIIESFGRAGETNLPLVLDAIVDTAPEISALVEAVSDLVAEALPALSNLSTGGLTALTGLAVLAEQVLSIFGALPDGIQRVVGGFVTLAAVIPGAGEKLAAGFGALARTLFTVVDAQRAVALNAAIMQGALTAGVLVAVQLLTTAMAKSAERNREFKESIGDATRSLEEFETFGEGALDFINKFRVAGEGVNIGNLEGFLDGLTTGKIERAFGATTEQVAGLVEELARVGGASNVAGTDRYTKALEAAGFSLADMDAAGLDAAESVVALSDQLAAATEVAFDAALSSKEFAFVSDKTAASLKRAAEDSGDYAGAMEKLEAANQRGAKVEVASAKARGATTEEINAAIAANTDFVTGTVDYVGALQDINEELAKQETLFQGMQERYRGFNETFNQLVSSAGAADLGAQFIGFALAIDEAALSGDELNAIANELGTTLGQALSGDELGKLVEVFVGRVGELRTSLESVVPSIEDLQFEADNFSLHEFLDELGRIADARFNVVENINRLLDEFGGLGTQVLNALLNSGLNKDQFAIVIEEAIAGGESKLAEIAFRFGAVTGPQVQALAERLAAEGFTPEGIEEALGVDAFAGALDGLEAQVARVAPLTVDVGREVALLRQSFGSSPLGPGQEGLLNAAAAATGAGTARVELPEIDVEGAVSDAEKAGKRIGTALGNSVKESSRISFQGVSRQARASVDDVLDGVLDLLRGFGENAEEAMGDSGKAAVFAFGSTFDGLSDTARSELEQTAALVRIYSLILQIQSAVAGRQSTLAFAAGLQLPETVANELKEAVAALAAPSFRNSAFVAGNALGFDLGRGIAAGITASIALSLAAIIRLIAITLGAAEVFAGISSPSKLFTTLGEQMGAGVSVGLRNSLPDVQRAAAEVASVAQAAAGGRLPVSALLGVGSGLSGSQSALSAVRPLGIGAPGRTERAPASSQPAASVTAGVVHNHQWNVVAPTDDLEALALRVAARLEQRIQR